MREIKFRIYEDNKMLYPEEYKNNGFDDYFLNMNGKLTYYQNCYDGGFFDFNGIIMQYTGLKDKNGKEIYEGDILKLHYIKNGKEEIKASVTYSEDYAQYVIKDTGYVSDDYEPLCDYEDLEVIGNIYENSNLLEE